MAGARLSVRVTARASRNAVTGTVGDSLAVSVTATPEGGKANAAVCAVIATALDVPKTRVRVLRGASSRNKIVEVEGLEQEAVDSLLLGHGGKERDR